MEEYVKIVKRNGEDPDKELYEKLHIREDWVQKSQIVAILDAPDAVFCIKVDTRTGEYSSNGTDPYSQSPLSDFAWHIKEVVFKRLSDFSTESRKELTEENLVDIIQESHRVCKRDWRVK